MNSHLLSYRLKEFASQNGFYDTSALSVALVLTDVARNKGLPIDPLAFMTDGGGQVRGLSGPKIKKILARHGITQTLSKEGGRTSRGTPAKMRLWTEFLNANLDGSDEVFDHVEAFWIDQVRLYFATKPFSVRVDSSHGLRLIVREILVQARKRQANSSGTNYVGAVMQHLVGAKLSCVLPNNTFSHYSFSTADQQSGRDGDFRIGEAAIHVTSAPSASLIERCIGNLGRGLRPLIVTSENGTAAAELFASQANIADRIDIFEIEQFVALNIYEMGGFGTQSQIVAVATILDKYNDLVASFETDQSLRIEFA